MSKLYKNLQYDTDQVMQPGDPLTSPNGDVEVHSNNDGTATIVAPGLLPPVLVFDNFSTSAWGGFGPISGTWNLKGPYYCTNTESGMIYTFFIPVADQEPPSECVISDPVYNPYEFCIFIPGDQSPMIMHYGQEFCTLQNLDTTNPSVKSHFADSVSGTITITRAIADITKTISTTDHTHTPTSIGAAEVVHTHSASDIVSGTLPVRLGGTGRNSNTINAIITADDTRTTGPLGNIETKSGALYATGTGSKAQFGILPLGQGGTGVNASSVAVNKVFASPANGSGGPSFRSLVAADIPDLNTSKLTTGTLGVARGGTGKSSHTINSVIIGGTSTTGALQNVAAASGAFYSTGADVKPQFGTLPAAQGGTGVNGSSQAINKVLASPASGSAGAISFRSLVEADIPTLSTSKISGLGNAATKNVGTASGTVAAGDHTHDATTISYTSSENVKLALDTLYETNLWVDSGSTDIRLDTSAPSVLTLNGKRITTTEDLYKSITYADLVTARTNSQLVPGATYRITDYGTTTAQADTQSAGHAFDLLVVADDVNKLNENAHAIQHAGDTYFANCNLAAWKIKYSLDNSTAKFAWATSSGKGVIYEMEDEWGNKCGYDFKNIQFKRYAISAVTSTMISGDTLTSLQSTLVYSSNSNITMARSTTTTTTSGGVAVSNYYGLSVTVDPNTFNWAYTFENSSNSSKDMSLDGSANGNVVSPYCTSSKYTLNNIVMRGNSISNVFDGNCRDMTFKSLANGNKFGYACYRLCLGGGASNTFGGSCHDMVISGASIIAMQHCTIGGGCHHITSGQRLLRNTIGPLCSNLSFSTFNLHNIIGTGCSNIHFGSSTGSKSYYQNITIEPNNQNIYLNCTGTTSSSAYYQNVTIGKGVNNTDTWKTITDANTNQKYETIYQAENSLVIPV